MFHFGCGPRRAYMFGHNVALARGKPTSALCARHGSCHKTFVAGGKVGFTADGQTTHKLDEPRVGQQQRPGSRKTRVHENTPREACCKPSVGLGAAVSQNWCVQSWPNRPPGAKSPMISLTFWPPQSQGASFLALENWPLHGPNLSKSDAAMALSNSSVRFVTVDPPNCQKRPPIRRR